MAYYCHEMIKKVAQELAGAYYEENMRDNHLYDVVKSKGVTQKRFIAKTWGHFIPLARTTLIKLLNSPTLPELAKEDIMDAVILDKQLPKDGGVYH